MSDQIVTASSNCPIAVELSGVGKTFTSSGGEAVHVLDGVDLKVRQGEFVTILGSTGCGKTTLLNLIAGLEPVDKGTIRMATDLRLGETVAYVFQHYTLFPWRTTLRNVSFGLQVRGLSSRDRECAARDMLARVGLAGFENAYPHELSGGMRQRAAIAQALAIQPKLLLMDEPFGAVDDSTRAELQEILIDLWREKGTTILFVTHNIDEAIVLGGRVVVLGDGPSGVIQQHNVTLPRPRDRKDNEFTNLFIRIRQSLSLGLD